MRALDYSDETCRASGPSKCRKRTLRRIAAVMLVSVLFCTLLGTSAFAEQDEEGEGSAEDVVQQPALVSIAPDPVLDENIPLVPDEGQLTDSIDDGPGSENADDPDNIDEGFEEQAPEQQLEELVEEALPEDAGQQTADGTLVFSAEELRGAASQTGSVRLGDHIVLDGSVPVIVPADAFFSVDLNGWSLVCSASVSALFDVRGHLTVTDASELDQPGSILAAGAENAFRISEQGTMTFQRGTIELSRGSRAFSVTDGGRLAIRDGSIIGTDEAVVPEGGAVYVRGADSVAEFSRGLITGTHAVSGGAVFTAEGGAFRMVKSHDTDTCDAQIRACSAAGSGGAVCIAGGGIFSMCGGAVMDNTAVADGGGIAAADGICALRGGAITGNTAQTGSGGGIWAGDTGAVDANAPAELAVNITGNRAGGMGGGIFLTEPALSGLDGHAEVAGNTAGMPPAPGDLVPASGSVPGPNFSVAVLLEDPNRQATQTSSPDIPSAAAATQAPAAEPTSTGALAIRGAQDTTGPGYVSSIEELAMALTDEAVPQVHLTQDISIPPTYGGAPSLRVPPGKDVTLHLDGHSIAAAGDGAGSLIDVQGTLVLSGAQTPDDPDEVTEQILFENGDSVVHVAETGTCILMGGCITAGADTRHAVTAASGSRFAMLSGSIRGQTLARDGGAVLLEAAPAGHAGTLAQISGGVIEGTGAAYGGGVAVLNGAQLVLSGTASIRGCRAVDEEARFSSGLGGGVYVEGGEFIMNGGSINSCSAVRGGAVFAQSGIVCLNAGTIGACTAQSLGDAIYVANEAILCGNEAPDSSVHVRNDNAGSGGSLVFLEERQSAVRLQKKEQKIPLEAA